MSPLEVLAYLGKMGYTKADITKVVEGMTSPAPAAASPAPAAASPAPAAASPAPAAGALAQIMEAITGLKETIQHSNIISTGLSTPKEQSVDDILAGVINPMKKEEK